MGGRITIHPSIQRYSDQQKTMKKNIKNIWREWKRGTNNNNTRHWHWENFFFRLVRATIQPTKNWMQKKNCPLLYHPSMVMLVVLFSLFFACFQCPFSSKTLCVCMVCHGIELNRIVNCEMNEMNDQRVLFQAFTFFFISNHRFFSFHFNLFSSKHTHTQYTSFVQKIFSGTQKNDGKKWSIHTIHTNDDADGLIWLYNIWAVIIIIVVVVVVHSFHFLFFHSFQWFSLCVCIFGYFSTIFFYRFEK